MARARRRRADEVVAPGGPPPWYRDVWPWLLALGLVVLALIGGYFGYQAYQDEDDSDDSPDVVTVTETTGTETETDTDTETGETETTETEATEPVQAPDVVGTSYVEAGATIEAEGLVADSYPVPSSEPRGTVVSQRPAAGTQLGQGETMRTNVALGDGPRAAREVPDVTGPQASEARSAARRAGFTVRTLYRDPPSPEESGEVLTQQPAPGTSAPDLTQITIFVGR